MEQLFWWILQEIFQHPIAKILEAAIAGIAIPSWIGRSKRSVPELIVIGLVTVATVLVITERVGSWVAEKAFNPQEQIREWLDDYGLSSRIEKPYPDDFFTLTVSGREIGETFSISQSKNQQGVITIGSIILPKPEIIKQIASMKPRERDKFWTTMKLELLKRGDIDVELNLDNGAAQLFRKFLVDHHTTSTQFSNEVFRFKGSVTLLDVLYTSVLSMDE